MWGGCSWIRRILFAAGYDIRSEAGLTNTISHIDRTIGLDNVPVFHVKWGFEDTAGRPRGSARARVGEREDWRRGVGGDSCGIPQRMSAMPPEGVLGRAFLLETPIDDPGDDRRNVARLWELAGLKDVAPAAEKGFSMMTPSMKKLRAKLAKEGKKVGSLRDLSWRLR